VTVALGLAWGAVLAAPFVVRSRRAALVGRVGALGIPRERRGSVGPVVLPWRRPGAAAVLTRVWRPVHELVQPFAHRGRERAQGAAVRRELPLAVDLLGVAVAAGCTPFLAVEVVTRWGPRTVVDRFESVLRRCELGASFESALTDMAHATPDFHPLVDALLVSDRLGAPIGPALARLADEARVALRRRAEAHARRVPVRLLFPLVFLVLPAFVLLTVVPGLAAGLSRL
jgi:hypothetical protein